MKKLANASKHKTRKYLRRKHRANTIAKASDKPRLIVSKSNKHISAQIVDRAGHVLAAADDAELTKGTKSEKAYQVGEALAKTAKDNKVTTVVFDRNGHLYHGRVEQLAEGARAGGLEL